MLRIVAICVFLLATATFMLSQDPEAGVTIISKSERVLRINSNRPLDSAAYILASDYQINISAEDPPFACPGDILEAGPKQKTPLAGEHMYLPKGSAFEIHFSVNESRYPANSRDLLDQVVAAYNRTSSFRYRVRQEGNFFAFVPASARDKTCHMTGIKPVLDEQISLPGEDMAIYTAVAAIESALSQKIGEPVHINTQDWLNRIPNLKVSFPSRSASARDLLVTVIKATHFRFYWLTREQPIHAGWVINLKPLTGRIVKDAGGGFAYPWIPFCS
jgi:hypothetical protein